MGGNLPLICVDLVEIKPFITSVVQGTVPVQAPVPYNIKP